MTKSQFVFTTDNVKCMNILDSVGIFCMIFFLHYSVYQAEVKAEDFYNTNNINDSYAVAL